MPDDRLERETLFLFEAMLELPEADRDAFLAERTEGRPDLAARLAAMREADRRAGLQTGAAVDALEEEAPPERIGAYRIVERIGRGGMGAVYRGERMTGDFAHVAAIKVIKAGLLSEGLVERFERERQTLAALRHPHIAQLYDGGETESGSPYIVMEFVDGEPLLAWIEAHAPDRETRCRLFAEICGAVAFANRNLIVHRDLTPANVLVTAEGSVKLIDFGIAKPVDAGAAPARTSLGSLSLTPGYAAPERMTSAQVTTAADIYSLGKLLAKMLPPAAGDRELRAIVARATMLDPADRYPTADALGADVAAWRAGMPVSAVGGGRGYVLRKFIGRHRLGVAGAAIALLLLVGALGAALFANMRAERALAESERRFGETRAIAKTLLFDAFDQVSRVPGSTQAREYLARAGLTYLEALAADENAPLDVRIEAGLGYMRLAQVVGGGQASQLGRYADADALLARSEEILGGLLDRHPDDANVRRAMAALLVEQSGSNLYNNNDVERARAQAIRAKELMAAGAAGDLEAARLYADALRAEGDTHNWDDAFPQARELHNAAESFIAGLPAPFQADPQMRSIRAGNLRLLGEAHHKLQEVEPARRTLDQAVEINRALVAEQPDDPLIRRRLATSLRYRAIVHRSNDRNELARQSIEESRAEAERLRARDPNDAGALQLVALVAEVQAQILADLRRFPESYAVGEQVRAMHVSLVEKAGGAAGAARSMAAARRTDGGNHYNGGDYAGACRIWRETLDLYAGLDRRGQLTDTDRGNAVRELTDYVQRTCNPPRAALGPSI